jgi:energy-coupling factor transport system substrate-specific component
MKPSPLTRLVYLLATIAAASAAAFAANALRNWNGGKPDAASSAAWVTWSLGLLLVAIVYLLAERRGAWEVGTREVVYMAIGAALYGVLSWLTNALHLPTVSLVSLRPAVAIPLFFGWVFGPIVGFFAGAMGNILGDFLTGWGVFPAWDLGNGLMGLVAGLTHTGMIHGSPKVRSEARRASRPLTSEVVRAVLTSWVAVLLGMGFASASSIYINGYTPTQALVTDFLPSATTILLMALLFVPVHVRAWEGVRGSRGR